MSNAPDTYIWGAKPLAKKLGLDDRQVFYLLENGRIPAAKIGGRWCTSDRAIDEYLQGKFRIGALNKVAL